MTIGEAILRILDEKKAPIAGTDIYNAIISNKYYDFSKNQSPEATVHAIAGRFIRHGDTRVKRVRKEGVGYLYYLTKYEKDINLDEFDVSTTTIVSKKDGKKSDFEERDLHRIFCTFLKSINIDSKTIYHEKSTKDDENQKWIHPDIIGVELLNLQTNSSKNFLKATNKKGTFKLLSYELKKEIKNDSELKKAYFQAVSNSSWANYGYLVAFEIDSRLKEEIERLNESFGIGVIELFSNPYQSKIICQSHYRELDIKTIDKLCKINKDFNAFIEQMEKLLSADERYYSTTEKELLNICDKPFKDDDEIKNYCKEKNIPFEENDSE
jgi:hypothetical protein